MESRFWKFALTAGFFAFLAGGIATLVVLISGSPA
jgi:hypothetical protein